MGDANPRGWPADPGADTPIGGQDRWALLVGISKYEEHKLSLQFAARDAAKLRDMLLQPSAGGFPAENIRTLIDEDATLANLTKALRTFLKKPAADDLVVLFLACHGSRDRDRLDNLYLLPFDTDVSDISGTALPMREVELALKETLRAQHVVLLADTCHSGGLGDAFAGQRGMETNAADLNNYLGELANTKAGLSLMTSAMEDEASFEDEKWGGGHGVFTHFVLEGLRGRADRLPYDGKVTVGELFDFVQDQVKQATDDSQHPYINASAQRSQVLAVTGTLSLNQHLALARGLSEAAELTGEATCWRGAAVQYGEVARLGGAEAQTEHGVERARALYLSGDAIAARSTLLRLPPAQPGVREALGLIHLAEGRIDQARSTMLEPEPVAPWAPKLLDTAPSHPRLALLVGLDRLDPKAFGGYDGRLMTPVAEVDALGTLLREQFGFQEQVRLVDAEATKANVLAALEKMAAESEKFDAVVVFLSGHGGQVPNPSALAGQPTESTFIAHDGPITNTEIHALLTQSAAGRTTLIAACAYSGGFAQLAKSAGYEVMTSCAPDETDLDGAHLSPFMAALLPNLRPGLAGSAVADAARLQAKKEAPTQHPQFSIAQDRPVLVPLKPTTVGTLSAQALLGATGAMDAETLARIGDLVGRGDLPPAAGYALATEWSRRSQFDRLPFLVEHAVPTSSALACATAAGGVRGASHTALTRALELFLTLPSVKSDPGLSNKVARLATIRISGTTTTRLRAVLIGVSSGAGSHHAEKVAAVRNSLVKTGVPDNHITTLVDAITEDVKEALNRAGGPKHDHPVLVYWYGAGTLDGLPCADGTLDRIDVAALAGPDVALVTPRAVYVSPILDTPPAQESIPRVTLYASARNEDSTETLTEAMTTAILQAGNVAAVRVSSFLPAGFHDYYAEFEAADALVVDPFVSRVDELTRSVTQAELRAAAALVEKLLEQRNGVDPEAQLILGVLRGRLHDYDAAVDALQQATQQFGGIGNRSGEAQARTQLGRVLMDSGIDRARAVSECRHATKLDTDLVEAWYWLGEAITELIAKETRAEAAYALRTYLLRGAPLGRRAEVTDLLGAMGPRPVEQPAPQPISTTS